MRPTGRPSRSAVNPGSSRTSISSPRRACKGPPNSSSSDSAHGRSDSWYGRIATMRQPKRADQAVHIATATPWWNGHSAWAVLKNALRRGAPRSKRLALPVRRLARAGAAFLVVFAGAIAIAAVVLGLWSRAQLKAIVVLAITERTPVVAPLVRLFTDTPRSEETLVGGQPTTLFRPGAGRGPWPAIVFVNGATRAGRFHPKVRRLAQGLARADFLVAVPDLPGLRRGQLTSQTTDALIRVAHQIAGRADVRGGRVSFYGVSVGATLSLLAVETPALAGHVRAVGGEAPWVDLEKVIRLATTGWYGRTRYRTDPYLRLAIARSLAAALQRGRDRTWLLGRLHAVLDD